MVESSKDILFLTLALCAVFCTVFFCWLLYYIIATVKKMHDTINFFSKILNSVDEFVSDVKQKAKSSVAYFRLFGVLTEKFVNYIEKKGFAKNKNKFTDDKEAKTKNKKSR